MKKVLNGIVGFLVGVVAVYLAAAILAALAFVGLRIVMMVWDLVWKV